MKTLFSMCKGGCDDRWYCKNAGKKGCNPTKIFKIFGLIPTGMVECYNFEEKDEK